ncbi:MAG: cellulase family glycosylhydrolase [Micavibrio sp.]|nr:cellulase family glycosylhydrolase [Micavibrio sp.]
MTNAPQNNSSRWTEKAANDWYKAQPLLMGANYVPASASNQIEMWQKDTFNIAEIDKELGWAKNLGMNTMRVFLHDLVWQEDAEGYKQRLEQFLQVAEKHGIKPLFVLFDSVWNPAPHTGPQEEPAFGVHNAGWVQGPGAAVLQDASQHGRLKDYVEGVVGAFAQDKRVLGWDVWNEPDNENGASYGSKEAANKIALVAPLLDKVFDWARSVSPAQPLTSGVWIGEWDNINAVNEVQQVQLKQSDIITFHNYAPADDFERRVKYLAENNRPLLCTEYMARPAGSTFEAILPVAEKHNIGLYNWGFVQGRTQTHLPWDSWQKPYDQAPPPVWFHEILKADGSPYRDAEADLIKNYNQRNAKATPAPASTPKFKLG